MLCADVGGSTYLPTCLLRKALSLAVQGLIRLSEGEMYVLFLWAEVSQRWAFAFEGHGLDRITYSPSSTLDWKTCLWYSMLITSGFVLALASAPTWAVIDVLTSLAARTLEDMLSFGWMEERIARWVARNSKDGDGEQLRRGEAKAKFSGKMQ